jgi:hypothetical protein
MRQIVDDVHEVQGRGEGSREVTRVLQYDSREIGQVNGDKDVFESAWPLELWLKRRLSFPFQHTMIRSTSRASLNPVFERRIRWRGTSCAFGERRTPQATRYFTAPDTGLRDARTDRGHSHARIDNRAAPAAGQCHHRIEIDLAHFRQVLSELREPEQDLRERGEISDWPSTVPVQSR